MELKNILSKIENVEKDILDYITNTEHYIFNWISCTAVQDFIKEYPEDYEDMIYLNVISVSESPIIRIYFTGHPDEIEYVERYTFLPTFRDTTKAGWLKWNGKVKEIQIAEKEQQIEYFKKQLEKAKKELEELKEN